MMKKRGTIMRGLAAAVLLSALTAPAAAAPAPDPRDAQALLKKITGRVLTVLRAGGEMPTDALRERINDIVLPHLDFVTMTKLAVGPPWRDATREQKRTLVTEFRELLVRTYTKSLDEYGGQQIKFLPLRPSPYPKRVEVRTRIIRDGGPPISVEYGLLYDDGEWKIYDIVVEGISLVTTYRTTFSRTVQQRGIDGLIAQLKKKNASGATAEALPDVQ